VSLAQLRDLVADGTVKPNDLVWREGLPSWQPAEDCLELAPPPPRAVYRPEPPPRYPAPRPPWADRPLPPPRPSASAAAWVVPLVVVGCVLGLGVLGFAGFALVGLMAGGPSAATPVTAVSTGGSIPYNGSALTYTGNVTYGDAVTVGDYLSSHGWIPSDHPVSIEVDRSGGVYKVRFCVRAGAEQDPKTIDAYRTLRADLARDVFPTSTVEIHLCDVNMRTVRTITLWN
jgi:hypothetical protein